jgi:hypothetical protein
MKMPTFSVEVITLPVSDVKQALRLVVGQLTHYLNLTHGAQTAR